MSNDLVPKAPLRKTGLSPKEQKLQAMLEKMKGNAAGAKPGSGGATGGFKAKGNVAKKTSFQRKAT
jgi:hypothetical protein